MEYVDYLGYQYRLIEFDLVEAFDDFFTGKKIFAMLLFGDHVIFATGYRSTQLVIVQHLAIQSAPLIAHQLEQWLTEISATSFGKWENPLVRCIWNGNNQLFLPVTYLLYQRWLLCPSTKNILPTIINHDGGWFIIGITRKFVKILIECTVNLVPL